MIRANRILAALATTLLGVPLMLAAAAPPALAAAPAFTSDDFAAGVLNASRWTVVDPVGDGTVSFRGVGTADVRLALAVPAGISHDAWGANRSLRIAQPVSNSDFTLDTRFTSTPTAGNQMQGVIIEQDAANWLRIDIHSTGTATRVFVARTVNGSSSSLLTRTVTLGSDAGLQVVRAGAAWTVKYRSAGSAWVTAGTVNHALTATRIGPFVGNAGTRPAFTAEVDWFFDAAAPIEPEDGTIGPSYPLTTTVSGQGTISRSPPGDSYATGTSVTLTATPAAGWRFVGWSGDAAGSDQSVVVVMDRARTVQATFEQNAPPARAFISDDFATGALGAHWTVVDPIGDGGVSIRGAGSGDVQLALSVPAGRNHDPWGTNRALRVMQPAADIDFVADTRFTSFPTEGTQMQGVIIEQDASNWLRFDVHSTATSTQLLVARTVNGSSSARLTKVISASAELGLRITRRGSSWTFEHSPDGDTWLTAGTVTHALAVTRIGPFAGNSGDKPAFTAEVDWFFDAAAPIQPEDGASALTYPLTTSLVGQGSVARSPSSAKYPAGTSVTLTARPALGWDFVRWSGDVTGAANPTTVLITRATTVVAEFRERPETLPTISVWYGDHQTFGGAGQPQRWVNVLGAVSDPEGMASLKYRLNGGPLKTLRLGPDLRRLYGPGDFNVELDYAELADGANQLELIAADKLGDTASQTVVLTRARTPAPLPTVVNWSASAAPDAMAQVVDGKWSTGPSGVTIQELGYDRTIAIGDVSWRDYEVTVPVTVTELGTGGGTPQSGAPLVGLGLHWNGHTSRAGESPAVSWYPTGAFAWYRWTGTGKHELYGNGDAPVVRQSMTWSFGTTYMFKARAQTEPGGVRYSYKWWTAGSAEPPAWRLSILEDNGPSTGSVLLVAHHAAATFGAVSVRPL